jgi:autotransporter translocation and assembly factor TamB
VEHEEIDAGLVVGGIEIQLDEKEGGHRSFLKSGKGQLVFEDTELTLEPLEAILEWKGTEILVSEATVRVGTSHARVQGALRPSPLIASLDVDYQVDPDLLRLWAPEMEMTGLVNGRAHFEMDDTGVRLQGDFRSSALTVKEIGPLEVGGEVQLTDDALELASVSLKGYGGTAELEGRVALRDGEKHNFRLRFSELDVASLTLGLTEWEPPLASRASGEARISLADWRLDDAEGQGTIHVLARAGTNAFSARGNITVSLASGILEFGTKDLVTANPRGEFSINGKSGLQGSLSADYQIDLVDLADLSAWTDPLGLPSSAPIEIAGPFSARGRLTGVVPDIEWTALLASSSLRLNGKTTLLSGDLAGTTEVVRVRKLDLQGDEGSLSAAGELGGGDSAAPSHLLVEFEGIPLPPNLPIRAIARGRARIVGTDADPDFDVTAALDELTLTGEHTGYASLRLAKKGEMLRLEEMTASLADASLMANGSYSLDSELIDGSLQIESLPLEEISPLTEYLEGVRGRVSLNVKAQGPIADAAGHASVTLNEVSLYGRSLPPLELELESQDGSVGIQGRLGDGIRLLTGSAALDSPLPVHIEVYLAALPLEEFLEGFFSFDAEDVSLAADGRLELDLPLMHPEEIRFRASVESYRASYKAVSHGATGFRIEGDRSAARIHNLKLVGTDRELSVEGVVPLNPEGTFDLEASGIFLLDFLEPLVDDLEVSGTARADLKVTGRLDEPHLVGRVKVEDSRGSWYGARWENLGASLDSREGLPPELSIRGKLLDGEVELRGFLPRALSETNEPGHLEFTFDNLELGRLAPIEGDVRPQLELSSRGTFEMPRWSLEGLRGSGEIVRVDAQLGELRFKNAASFPWHFEENIFSTPKLRLAGDQTDVTLSLPRLRIGDPIDFTASVRGTIDNAVINPLLSSVPPSMKPPSSSPS